MKKKFVFSNTSEIGFMAIVRAIKHFLKVLFNLTEVVEGELDVASKGEVAIEVDACDIDKVQVEFVGEPELPPCDPCDPDALSWSVWRPCYSEGCERSDHRCARLHTGGKHILIIRWDVSSVRKIAWKVFY